MAANDENTTGIPECGKVERRRYTLSDEAIAQRKAAAKKPKGEGVSRNAWKHGMYASENIRNMLRPCKSTCEYFDTCAFVENGQTNPGGDCLDKYEVAKHFTIIIDAIRDKAKGGCLEEVSALVMAKNVTILQNMQEDILEDGALLKEPSAFDKDGNVIGHRYKLNPVLDALPKIMNTLGLTPEAFLLTPQSKHKAGAIEEGAGALANVLSNFVRKSEE